MKMKNGKRSLEAYKVFPYVAWSVTIAFSFFVYNVTMDLKEITVELKQQTDNLQNKVNTDPAEIDFEA